VINSKDYGGGKRAEKKEYPNDLATVVYGIVSMSSKLRRDQNVLFYRYDEAGVEVNGMWERKRSKTDNTT